MTFQALTPEAMLARHVGFDSVVGQPNAPVIGFLCDWLTAVSAAPFAALDANCREAARRGRRFCAPGRNLGQTQKGNLP